MTLDQFTQIAAQRVPTPQEFLSFVEGMGWRIGRKEDGRPALKAPPADPVAQRLARMLGREPYRTEVLALVGVIEERRAVRLPREWLFPAGSVLAESPDDLHYAENANEHPSRATHWRHVGESEWKEIRRAE